MTPDERAGEADGLRRMNWGAGRAEVGWWNSDLRDEPDMDHIGDIAEGLPVGDGTFEYIASIHALPMIRYPELVPTLIELRRTLVPGGVLRLVLPDLEKGVSAWRRGDSDYFVVPDSDESTISGKLICQLLWYGWSSTLFTREWIEDLLIRAGFVAVHHATIGQSPTGRSGICDLDNREAESLFVEAVAP